MSKIKDDFIIQHRGKPYILYGGYLDAGHQESLGEIDTVLLQIPNNENGNVAVVKATVVTEKGKFSALGDAHTGERGPASEAPIRMAETRAKRRALSDAVNAGHESEEAPESEETSSASPTPLRSVQGREGAARTAGGAPLERADHLTELLIEAGKPAGFVRPRVLQMSEEKVEEKIVEYEEKEAGG